MTFDSSISRDISLSKILDVFIIDNEQSNIILTYLRQHDDKFEDILKYSQYCDRIFQLDFFLTCSKEDQEYLLTKLKDTSIDNAALLTWQILKSDSGKVQHIKYKLRNELHWILENGPRHPYGGRHAIYITPIDDICFELAEKNRISELPLIVDNKKLCKYFKYFSYSLFRNRLVQYDFFENLDSISKFMFIRDVFYCMNVNSIRNFAMQLLDSDASNDIKKECISNLAKLPLYQSDILDIKTRDLIDECKSFSEMMLKMTIFNADVSSRVVLYLLLYRKKWIYEWFEYDKENLDMNLNISRFVEEELKCK